MGWSRMADDYDSAVQGKLRFPMPAGKEALIASLCRAFPADEAMIRKYFAMIEEHQSRSGLYFGSKVVLGWLPRWAAGILAPLLTAPYYAGSDRTVQDVLTSLFPENERLRGVLAYQWGDYGLTPEAASWAIHCMVVNHYLHGAAYPTGGAAELARRIIPTIVCGGGAVLVNAAVRSIIVDESSAALGVVVKMGAGETAVVACPTVISAVGARVTFEKLLPQQF
eukprot:COSAG03_NODE_638_length_6574_cov_63.934054_1_plen_223_part_10